MPRFRRFVILSVWCALLLAIAVPGAVAPTALAQDGAAERGQAVVREAPQREDVVEALEEIGREPVEGEPAVHRTLREIYTLTLDELSQLAETYQRRQRYRREAEEAPAQIEQIRAELAEPPGPLDLGLGEEPALEDMLARRTQLEAELATTRTRLAEHRAELQRRPTRRTELPTDLVEATRLLDEAIEFYQQVRSGEEPEEVTEARLNRRAARVEAARQRLRTLEAEREWLDATEELLRLRRDRALRREQRQSQSLDLLSERIRVLRERQAEAEARDARRLAEQVDPAIRTLAEENIRLRELATGTEDVDGLAASLTRAEATRRSVLDEIQRIRQDFRNVKARLDAGVMSAEFGALLRRQHALLADPRQLRRDLRRTRNEISRVDLLRIELQERAAALERIDERVEQIVNALPADIDPQRRARIEAEAARLLETQKADLEGSRESVGLIEETRRLSDALAALVGPQQQLLELTQAYRDFIDERVLWIRSNNLPSLQDFRDGVRSLIWFIDPRSWQQIGQGLLRLMPAEMAAGAMSIALISILFSIQPKFRRRLRDLAERVSQVQRDKLLYTFAALGLTGLLAIGGTLLMFTIAWLLRSIDRPPEQATAIAAGLESAAIFYLLVVFLLHLCRPKGLADAHFRWPDATLRLIRSNARWFALVAVPAVFLSTAAARVEDPAFSASIGRVAFIVAMVALLLFTEHLLRPSGAIMEQFFKRHRGGWLDKLKWIWFPIIVGLPAGLALLSLLGYHYTAQQLSQKLVITLWILLTLVILNSLGVRWLFVMRRRLALEQARQRRAAAETKAAESETKSEIDVAAAEANTVDISSVNAQTKRLVQTGVLIAGAAALWITWVSVFPALGMLDRVQLYPQPRIVDEADLRSELPAVLRVEPEAAPTPTPAEEAEEAAPPPPPPVVAPTEPADEAPEATAEQLTVTLVDLGLLIAFLVLTWIAAKNVPGLLEITILQRLPMDAGGRFAVSTITRYIVVILGVALAANAINITWSTVQWLAAALTFGLAFGLQEIFANFVSGLIMLFERPVRVGDTVTVGSVSGRVTRIRMRATTITDWDRKELIVPNKEFITGQLVNWSLSDSVIRTIIPVGIAYGSDTDKAKVILRRIAQENPHVLDDPEPQILFMGFGDSSLNFEVRLFLPNLDNFAGTRDAMHMAIDKAFREAGIEIAFPQRDIHIRSVDGPIPLENRRSRRGRSESAQDGQGADGEGGED